VISLKQAILLELDCLQLLPVSISLAILLQYRTGYRCADILLILLIPGSFFILPVRLLSTLNLDVGISSAALSPGNP
jgi:hypothetical protein